METGEGAEMSAMWPLTPNTGKIVAGCGVEEFLPSLGVKASSLMRMGPHKSGIVCAATARRSALNLENGISIGAKSGE